MKMPATVIREEIRKSGVISFARFMELALYCPETGYYEAKKDSVGQRGDFITSVSVGSLFGELLAFQFAEWLEELRIVNSELRIVEAGAHDGKLAADIMGWLQAHRPSLFSEIEFCIVEPSARRQAWQKATLENFIPHVRWFSGFNDSTIRRSNGIIFSNELLDAFPVHRHGWDALAKQWFEWGVTLDGDKLVWTRITHPPSLRSGATSHASRITHHAPPELLYVLPDGYTVEISPSAETWWRETAGILQRGKLLTIDYGFTADEMFSPVRRNGTLRAYHRHRVTDDLLAHPGEQDLTAHVNFSAIQKVGETAGLKTELFCTQSQFLTRILQTAVAEGIFAEWNARRVRQFQTLTHPEHLGRAFRVLVQSV